MQSDATATIVPKKRFWIFFVLAVAAYFLMRYLSGQLTGKTIIDFEMAKTVAVVESMMEGWGVSGIERFLKSTYGDFLFIVGYTGALFYGCRYFGRLAGNYILQKAGKIFSFLAIVAGLSDVIENICMIYTLKNSRVEWVTHFTYDLARIKFSLIFILIIYILICLLFWAIDRLASTKK